jgi:ABC-2 type transport system ATP-binding protein
VKLIRCATTLVREELWVLPGVSDVTWSGRHVTVTSRRPEAALREMLALDGELTSLEVQSPALEDALLALTARGER